MARNPDGEIIIGAKIDLEELKKGAKDGKKLVEDTKDDLDKDLHEELQKTVAEQEKSIKEYTQAMERVAKVSEELKAVQDKTNDFLAKQGQFVTPEQIEFNEGMVEGKIEALRKKLTEEQAVQIKAELDAKELHAEVMAQKRVIEDYLDFDLGVETKVELDKNHAQAEWGALLAQFDKLELEVDDQNAIDRLTTQYNNYRTQIELANIKLEQQKQSLAETGDLLERATAKARELAADTHASELAQATANKEVHELQMRYAQLQNETARTTRNIDNMAIQTEKTEKRAYSLLKTFMGIGDETDNNRKKQERHNKSIDGVGKGLKAGIKQVGKYAFALLSLRSVYATLSSLSRAWLNSADQAAQQMRVNMDYLKVSFGSLLSGPLQALMNMLYKIAGLIGSIIYAFSGINVFANYAAQASKSLGSGAKSAKEINKSLAPFDEKQVLAQPNESGGSGGGGGGMNQPMPELIDIHQFDEMANAFKRVIDQMISDIQPFLDIIKSIDLEPLQKAFKRLGKVGAETANILWKSFARVLNETIGPFIKIMMEDIYPRFLLALADVLEAVNPLLEFVLKELIEPIIQWFMLDIYPAFMQILIDLLHLLVPLIEILHGVLENLWVILSPIVEVLKAVLVGVLEVISGLIQKLTEFISEHSKEIEILATVVIAGVGAFKLFQLAIKGIQTLSSMNPFGWIVIAIMAILTIMEVLGIDWEDITNFFSETIADIKQWFSDLGDRVGEIFDTIGQTVDRVVTSIKDKFNEGLAFVTGLLSPFLNAWEKIMGVLSPFIDAQIGNIKRIFSGLLNFITGVFTGDWRRAWQGVLDIFGGIFRGLGNLFLMPINGIVNMINFFIRQLNKVKVPDWVPGVGGFGINISPVSKVPYLAKGGIINRPTMAVVGEAGKEAVMPLERNTGWIDELADKLSQKGGNNMEGGVIALHVNLDGREISRKIVDINELDRFARNR